MNSRNKKTYSMVLTAMLLALGLILPFITGNIQAIAKIISPLHIPVLICGLCCGWKWGLGLGMILPLFRSLLFSIPVFPTSALPMVFELGTYGLLTQKRGRRKESSSQNIALSYLCHDNRAICRRRSKSIASFPWDHRNEFSIYLQRIPYKSFHIHSSRSFDTHHSHTLGSHGFRKSKAIANADA